MANLQRIEGIILKTEAHGEFNKVVWVLSKTEGVLQVLARGAMKSKKRFAGRLEMFTGGLFQCHASGRGRPTLVSVDVTADRFTISAKVESFYIATCIADWALHWRIGSEDCAAFYRAVSAVLDFVAAGNSELIALIWFEVRLLALSGLWPDTETCSICNESLEDVSFALCLASGCFVHRTHGGNVKPVGLQGVRTLRRIQAWGIPHIARLRISDGQAMELFEIIAVMFAANTEFLPASRKMILRRFRS